MAKQIHLTLFLLFCLDMLLESSWQWIIAKNSVKNMDICGSHYPISTKFQILIEPTNANKCSGLKAINKCYLSVTTYIQALTFK